MKHCVCLLLATALAGCSSDDGGSSQKPAEKPRLAFVSDAKPAGVTLSLRQQALTPDQLVLEVVGSSLPDTYGVAFRLSYDSAVLNFDQLEPGAAWSSPIVHAVAKPSGLLVAAVSAQGQAKGVGGADVVLAVIGFELSLQQPTAIDFVADRSGLVAPDGKPLKQVGFAGGDLLLQ